MVGHQEKFRSASGRFGTLEEVRFYAAPEVIFELFEPAESGWCAVVTHMRLSSYFAFRVGISSARFAGLAERTLVKVSRE